MKPPLLLIGTALSIWPISAWAQDPEAALRRSEQMRARIEKKLNGLHDAAAAPATGPAVATRTGAPATSVRTESERRVRTIAVDCAEEDASVTGAIARARPGPVVVEVSGTCRETVTIDRSDVTLKGASSGTAVIRPPTVDGKPAGPGIRARNAHGLVLQDLTVTGGTDGIVVVASRGVTLVRVTSTLNTGPGSFFGGLESLGAAFDGSAATIADSTFSQNEAPLMAYRASFVTVEGSNFTDNSLDGPFSFDASTLNVSRSVIARNGYGPQAIEKSRTAIRDSTVDSSVETLALDGSQMSYSNTVITGTDVTAFRRSGMSLASSTVTAAFVNTFYDSILEIYGTTIDFTGDADAGIYALGKAYVRARRLTRPDGTFVWSNIHGAVSIGEFSDASFQTSDPLESVFCYLRSRAHTTTAPTYGTFGCE